MFKKIFPACYKWLSHIFNSLFGQVAWQPPTWFIFCRQQCTFKRQTWLLIICMLSALAYGYYWYHTRPQLKKISVHVLAPKITPLDKVLVPDNLILDFGIETQAGELNLRTVAPLNLVGKEVSADLITLDPPFAGKWTWQTDSQLLFKPTHDWPANQPYTIHFAKNAFTPGTKMANMQTQFSTAPFNASIQKFSFYQDPTNPKLKQAIATIAFNYPVDPSSLEKNLSLSLEAIKNGQQDLAATDFKYSLTYDEHKRLAYLRSESLSLPPVPRYLQLTLKKNIQALNGSATLNKEETATLIIPDRSSYFKISKIAAMIVRNAKDNPEQILTVETSSDVSEADLHHTLHAYILPKDKPASKLVAAKANYAWQNPSEITADILAKSTPLALHPNPTDREQASLHSYQFNAPAPGAIYVQIDKGTHAFGDYYLAENVKALVKIPAFPQEIHFLHKGSLLALGTEEKLSVSVRGLDAVKFSVARILASDVNHLVTQTVGDFSNPIFLNFYFNQNNMAVIGSEIQSFANADPAKAQYSALDFKKYFNQQTDPSSLGLFLLTAHGWDPLHKQNLPIEAKRLILITDLGLIAKNNNNGSHDVFVQSISQGKPLNKVTVDILGKNGVPIFSRSTDELGHISFPNLNDFVDEREPVVYLAHLGNDVSFLPFAHMDRNLNFSRFDVGGISSSANNENQSALSAYIFSDRGVYRPGDTVHYAMIIKLPFAQPAPTQLPLEAIITDPRGNTVKDQKLILDSNGYLTFDFKTTDSFITGQYSLNLYIIKDNHPDSLIGYTDIQVVEFLPDRMHISAHLSKPLTSGWLAPNDLTATVNLANLYGTPATGRRITGKIVLTPHAVSFNEYADYIFVDPLLNPKVPAKSFNETLGDVETNQVGDAIFNLNLERFDKATYQLVFFAEGFEAEGGRSVTTQLKTLVSPLAHLVGYRPDGDLHYIKQNTKRSVNFMAINPQLKPEALSALSLQLAEQHPVTTLVKKENGTYEYQSIIQDKIISRQALTIDAQGSAYTLPSNTIGDFEVALLDSNNNQLSHFNYTVVGDSQLSLAKNAEMNVKLNKSEFSAGEEIEMQITAPYTGSGLITLERDKVYAAAWFNAQTTTSMQKIRIPTDFQGDGYVNVAFIRDLNSPEIFMSPLSYSITPFTLSHHNETIHVDLSVPQLIHPAEPLVITYQTDKPCKLIVFAVDEGILQVAKYEAPDPLKYFFQKHALQVETMQIVDQILPKYIAQRELSAVGGDNGAPALNKNLNPFKRKIDAPVVYWSQLIDADNTPRQLIYNVPDYFNGSLKIMAVAASLHAVGAAAKTSMVRGDFVINPNVPLFVAPGDDFEVTASIANNIKGSGKNASIDVTIASSDAFDIRGSAVQQMIIPEGEERTVHFKLHTKAILGGQTLTLSAHAGNHASSLQASLSVRPLVPYSTTIQSGYADAASKTLVLNHQFPEFAHTKIMASASPLILAYGLSRYLDEYPYGCTEQLTSKAFPLLALANVAWFTKEEERRSKVEHLIELISPRQNSSGGFNFWPNSTDEDNPFLSVYVMHFLTEARAQQFNVSNDVFNSGIAYLKSIAEKDSTNLPDARTRAYAIYVLTRNEIVTTNYLTHLQIYLDKQQKNQWTHDITCVLLAASYQLLKSDTDANTILNQYQPNTSEEKDDTDFYNPKIAKAMYLYLLAQHFPERLPKLDAHFIADVAQVLNEDQLTTILSSYTSLALSAYHPFTSNEAYLSLTIETFGKGVKQSQNIPTNLGDQIMDIKNDVEKMTIKNDNQRPYFYQLQQSGFRKDLPNQAEQHGIEVFREYRQNDQITNKINLGSELVVHLTIRGLDDHDYNNIAIVDLLPGGFEVVRDSLNQQNQNMDYVDAREDRVIFFTAVSGISKELTYKIKATNVGRYATPPYFAASMYDPKIKSIGTVGQIEVIPSQANHAYKN